MYATLSGGGEVSLKAHDVKGALVDRRNSAAGGGRVLSSFDWDKRRKGPTGTGKVCLGDLVFWHNDLQ